MSDKQRMVAAVSVASALGLGGMVMLALFAVSGEDPGAFQVKDAYQQSQTGPQSTPDAQMRATTEPQTGATAAKTAAPQPSAQPVQPLPSPARTQSGGDPKEAVNDKTGEEGRGQSPTGPAGWPEGLPYPDAVTLIEEDLNGHARFVLATPTGMANTGGAIVEALTESGWKVTTVGTVRSATIVARRGPESVGISLRDQSGPDGPSTVWDLVYQQEPPPAPQPTPSSTGTLQQKA